MVKLYLVRHGKTEFNQKGYIQGGTVDSPLLEEGLTGATLTGKALADIHFDQVLVSPQKRAQDTAGRIMKENKFKNEVTLVTKQDLREMEFGSLDGSSLEDFNKLVSKNDYQNNPEKYDPSAFNGETYQELMNRSRKVIDDALKNVNKEDSAILVVAHGITLLTLINNLIGNPLSKVREKGMLDNTSITILSKELDQKDFELTKWNQTEHII